MKNKVSHGNIIEFTAPSGGVTSGVAVKIGAMLAVAVVTAAQGEVVSGDTEGVFDHAAATHATDQAWAFGDTIYWDDTAKVFTKTSSGNTKAGYAVAAKVSTVASGRLRLVPTI